MRALCMPKQASTAQVESDGAYLSPRIGCIERVSEYSSGSMLVHVPSCCVVSKYMPVIDEMCLQCKLPSVKLDCVVGGAWRTVAKSKDRVELGDMPLARHNSAMISPGENIDRYKQIDVPMELSTMEFVTK